MKILVLTTYPSGDASRRLRIDPIVTELRGRGHAVKVHTLLTNAAFRQKNRPLGKVLAAAVLGAKTLTRMLLMLRSVDICIIHREAFPFFTPHVEAAFRKRSKTLVIDVDDAIDESPTHGRDWREPLRDPPRFRAALQLADLAICGSPALAAKYSSITNTVFSPTCPPRVINGDGDREQNLVCWIGSQSTLDSLAMILPMILDSCTNLGLHLEVVGGPNVQTLPKHPAMSASLWTPAIEVDLLNRAAIGLMPLPDSAWEKGKSAYKCLLYMSAGIVPVVSPVGMNAWLSRLYPEIVVANGDWEGALAKGWQSAQDKSVRNRLRQIIEHDFSAPAVTAETCSHIESVHLKATQNDGDTQ